MSNEEIISNIYSFLYAICIEAGCGYDIKQISYKILSGKIDYEQAIEEWKHLGHCLLIKER